MMRCSVRCLLFGLLLLFPNHFSFGQGSGTTQYQLKAVFLYNFTQFVEWPTIVFNSADEPFKIGVYGPNEFGPHLDEAVRNEQVGGHRIKIVAVSSLAEAKECHLLFINGRTADISSILSQLKGHNILTVSDAVGFCSIGGMIALTNVRNKIRIQINDEAVKNSSLKISSKLMRIAEVVSLK